MTFEEYLARFRLLQHVLERDEKALSLMQSGPYRSFVSRFGTSKDPVLRSFAAGQETLHGKLERHRRLCERYASRLAHAIYLIPVGEIRDFARFHYLYGLTHEEIADMNSFSVRTVYRHAKRAKNELKKRLLEVSPKIKGIPPAKFHVKGKLPRKDYRIDPVSESVARLTARRKSEPFRPNPFPF